MAWGFTPDIDLIQFTLFPPLKLVTTNFLTSLAHISVSVSGTVLDMDKDTFWNKVTAVFGKQTEVVEGRTRGSRRSRWSSLQKQALKYIVAEVRYRCAIPSGEVEQDTIKHFMAY